MKKNRLLNRTLSFGLALALFLSSPASVYAEGIDNASTETILENISEEADASDGGESSGSESTTASEGTNSETGSESKDSDQVSSDASTSENDSNSDEQVNKGETPESSDKTADDAEADADKKADADADADKDAEDEDEEITYDYESNNDGTHVKKWTDKDGVAHEETEDCEFGEDGKCVHCGYEKEEDEDDEEITFETTVGKVKITVKASKKVLNGATSVSAEKLESGKDYDNVEKALSDNAEEKGRKLIDFAAYDIKLVNDDGDYVEPTDDGKVSVSIKNIEADDKSAVADAEAEVTLVHFEGENNSTEFVDITSEKETNLDTGNDTSIVDVDFVTDSFSIYSVAWVTPSTGRQIGSLYWGNQQTANLYLVDNEGNAIPWEIQLNTWISKSFYNSDNLDKYYSATNNDYFEDMMSGISEIMADNGYEYSGAWYVNGNAKNQITNLSYNTTTNIHWGWIEYHYGWYYENNSNDWSILGGESDNYDKTINIYITYSKDTEEQYFTANLFNYEMDYVNETSVGKLPGEDGVLLFHNQGGDLSADYNNKYYSGKKWNLCDTVGNSSGNPTAYQGIVDSTLLNNMPSFKYAVADIFDPNSSLFKNHNYRGTTDDTVAYKDVNVPFIKDSDGYYVFDTTSNETVGKYNTYVYDESSNSLVRSETDSKTGFWPFGTSDYHFGMDLQVYFNINENGLNDKGTAATKFEFAGDDDVWVFIDGKLALDMGGIHQTVTGDINFENGTCNVKYAYNEAEGLNRAIETHNLYTDILGYSSVEEGRKALASGGHSLTIFYLERGAGASNCKIKFNFHDVNVNVPVDVSFDKVDEIGNPLEGAKFGLFAATDTDCSGDALYEAVSTAEGKVIFEDIPAGTYLLKETDAPTGYKILDTIYTVTVTNGTKVIEKGQVTSESAGSFTIKDSSGNSISKIENELEEEIDPELMLDYSKEAKVENWEDRTYAITLTADAYVKKLEDLTVVNKSDVVLVIDATNSMYFPADLQETTVNKLDQSSTYYFIDSDDAATNYRVYYDNGWKYEDASYTYVTDANGNSVKVGGGNTGTIREEYNSSAGKYSYYKARSSAEITTFYYSPSDGEETRLKQLQEQTTYFLKELNALCGSKCKVGIVYFNSGQGVLADMQSLTKDNTDNLINIINGSYATSGSLESKLSGGTNQGNGLAEAETMINGLSDSNKKYVVTLTDGCPTVSGVADAVTTIKNRLVQKDVTLLSVGIQLSVSNSAASEVLKAAASNDNYVYDKSSGALEEIYDGIIEIIIGGKIVYEYKAGTIKDVVDQRFELVPDSNNYGADSIVKNSDGTTTITWSPSELNEWSKTIYVKAKSDFMGGNVITTNTSESGLTVEGETYKFKQPTVNVRLLDMELDGDEITLLLNDEFSPSDLQKALVSYFGSNVNFDISESTINSLLTNGNATITYSYGSTQDAVGELKLILSVSNGTPTGENATASKLGYHVYEYKLQAIYEAYSYGDRINSVVKADTNKTAPLQTDIDAGYKLDERTDALYTKTKSVEASYFVNVVNAGMYLTKVGGSKLTPLEGAKYVLSGDANFKTTIGLSGKNGSMLFSGLGVGTYYLKETEAPKGYALSNEVFTIVIERNDPTVAGEYKMTITSSNNKSEVPQSSVFDVRDMVVKTSSGDVITTYMISELSVMNVIDTIAYTLPETGGSGVYVYTIGGILLMIAGALLLYKNKNNKSK